MSHATDSEIYRALHAGYGSQPAADVILFGASTRGPVGLPVALPTTGTASPFLSSAFRERHAIAAGATTLTLAHPPREAVTTTRLSATGGVPDAIPGLALDGAAVTFLPYARTEAYAFQYQLPAHRFWLADGLQAAVRPAVRISTVRVNGAHATAALTCGDDSNPDDVLVLVAMHGGTEGNDHRAQLAFVGTGNVPTLIISHLAAYVQPRALAIALTEFANLAEVAAAINASAQTTGVAACARIGSGRPSDLLTAGSRITAFTGGADGLQDGIPLATATPWHRATEDAEPETLTWSERLATFVWRSDLARCSALYLPIEATPPTDALEAVDVAVQAQIREDAEGIPVRFYDIGASSAANALAVRTRLVDLRADDVPPVSLSTGEVITTTGARVGLGLRTALTFVQHTGERALTGLPVGLVGLIDTDWSPVTRRELTASGIQTASQERRTGLVFAHDYATVHQDGEEALYLTRTAQTIQQLITETLSPYRGRTMSELPPLGPFIESVLASHPAIKSVTYDVTVYEVYNRVDIKIDAQLYGELALRVEVRI